VLDAALDAVAAANVHVLVHAHAVERHAQGARNLVGELGHLDGGPHVEDLAPGVPARHHAEGLDRHRGAAAPFHPQRQLARAGGKIPLDLTPDEGPVEQDVGAVRLMHQHGARFDRLFGVEHEGPGLVADIDFFGRVLGQRPRVGHHGGNPFAGQRAMSTASGRRGTFGVSSPVISGSVAAASSRPSRT
jgi:hypothetical protein